MRAIVDIYKSWYEKGLYTRDNIDLFLRVNYINQDEYNYILSIEETEKNDSKVAAAL